MGGGTFPWGLFDFGPYLVDSQHGVASMGGGSKTGNPNKSQIQMVKSVEKV